MVGILHRGGTITARRRAFWARYELSGELLARSFPQRTNTFQWGRRALLPLKPPHFSILSHSELPRLRHLVQVPPRKARQLRASPISCVAELMCASYGNVSSPFNILENITPSKPRLLHHCVRLRSGYRRSWQTVVTRLLSHRWMIAITTHFKHSSTKHPRLPSPR